MSSLTLTQKLKFFAGYPTLVHDFFGMQHISVIYTYIITVDECYHRKIFSYKYIFIKKKEEKGIN